MNDSERACYVKHYLSEVAEQLNSGQAKEHAYRPAFKKLMDNFDDIIVINDPKRSEHGAPDFVYQKKSNNKIIKGYTETKDLSVDLDREEKSDQMRRYQAYSNLILTNYLEFRFFRNGTKYKIISIGEVKNGKLIKYAENDIALMRELEAFLTQTPEKITNGLRLAQIMGGRARRIRDNVIEYLKQDNRKNNELNRIFSMMKELLVRDLEPAKFADMYAQTLVYGLFVARYNDSTLKNFTRSEARDLVPRSNPFLLQFFDHIVGPNFDNRLAYIVDELCEIFSVSNVQEIVHRHLNTQEDSVDDRDPIIHFYEDFLQEYDPAERKRMGAYYTPVPVVKYIIRQVDRILKEDFGIAKGLASDEMITYAIPSQPWRKLGEKKDRFTIDVTVPRVQILDPAVGTATFLNEIIKYIYQGFKGQEGRWPAYVNENLLKRLFGFELMMAPYTIAHMKLAMTLKETGVDSLIDRLGVYLTNTLEEGIPLQPDLFTFGLAEAVSEESRLAAQIKSENPIMVIIGNPPYSVSSSNNSNFIKKILTDYKVNLNERNIQPLSDDYIKFIRFAEYMIAKNGSGVLAMITNNSYFGGLIHRQMRKHILQTFDSIYVLDLHGNAKKKEVAPDGSKDENVFNIQQGVGIVLAVKNSQNSEGLAKLFHAELFGSRQHKFENLDTDSLKFRRVQNSAPTYFFSQNNIFDQNEYDQFVSLRKLMPIGDAGIKTHRDRFAVAYIPEILIDRLTQLRDGDSQVIEEYSLKDTRDFKIQFAKEAFQAIDIPSVIKPISYRPFDNRFFVNNDRISDWPRNRTMSHLLGHPNIGLATCRQQSTFPFQHVMVVDRPVDMCLISLQTSETGYVFPLYIYQDDGTRAANFAQEELSKLTGELTKEAAPEDILDYIYAILHSPSYREKYRDFLKLDFPRVPIPSQTEFDHLVPLGGELRQLHLMKSPLIDQFATTFPLLGANMVENVKYADQKVWINKAQYFGNVPELAWRFYIGGYQPAQKWLKDRKGRQLTDADLVHYQRIIKILLETDRIMQVIG